MSKDTATPGVQSVYSGIDLRIENPKKPLSSWYAAFTDGWLDGDQNDCRDVPYDDYKIVKNCTCHISLENSPFAIRPRNLAIVFYRSGQPVRLLLASILTDYNAMIASVLSVAYGEQTLAAHLRNDLACKGDLVFIDAQLPSEAVSSSLIYEPMVCPFGSSSQLFAVLKSQIKRQRPVGGFDSIDAKYIYRDSFRMQIEVCIKNEIFRNEYRGALVCRTEEALYPLLKA